MRQSKTLCVCGKGYWPKQAWAHVRCAETNVASNVVVNVAVVNKVVVNNDRSKDRHKGNDTRREYVRKKMQEYRAKKKAAKK